MEILARRVAAQQEQGTVSQQAAGFVQQVTLVRVAPQFPHLGPAENEAAVCPQVTGQFDQDVAVSSGHIAVGAHDL